MNRECINHTIPSGELFSQDIDLSLRKRTVHMGYCGKISNVIIILAYLNICIILFVNSKGATVVQW